MCDLSSVSGKLKAISRNSSGVMRAVYRGQRLVNRVGKEKGRFKSGQMKNRLMKCLQAEPTPREHRLKSGLVDGLDVGIHGLDEAVLHMLKERVV